MTLSETNPKFQDRIPTYEANFMNLVITRLRLNKLCSGKKYYVLSQAPQFML